MQCVKVRAIMTSYLNIHLNLFPFYVLLLLLTLAEGRPSSRIRDRYSRNPGRDSNALISSLLSLRSPSSSITSSPSSELKNADFSKPTGSWSWSTLNFTPRNLMDIGENDLRRNSLPHSGNKAKTMAKTHKNTEDSEGWKSLRSPLEWAEDDIDADVDEGLDNNDNDDKSPAGLLMGQASRPLKEAKEEETVETGSPEDSQQLDKFRNNILKELGFETTTEPSPVGILPDIPAPKWNITREEYIGAYAQYMYNVKQRRQKSRSNLGARNRRKNAITFVQTYYDNGSDHVLAEGGVMRTFSFDINMEPRTKHGVVRVRRATLSFPAPCSLINGFPGQSQNQKNSPGGQNTSKSLLEVTGDKQVSVDLTEDVTSWLFHTDSSPFEVPLFCPQLPANSPQNSTASLRLVTAEVSVPAPESGGRSRRSALKSTLQNFEARQRKGQDCTKTRRGKTCCRRSLKVKFSELGISDVIIEPQEFDAHVCVGRCNAKRVAYSSTHAMFQHILHQTKGKKFAPRPCCAPTKLTELDVIHLDPTGTKLEVTVLSNAIVGECGCS